MPSTAVRKEDNWLHIAVGVIRDAQGRILISQRRHGTPGAGLWEFPGGKREAGESIEQSLARELNEELGIQVRTCRPLIRIRHRYRDRNVLLDTWLVTDWQGRAQGLEGQALTWAPPAELANWSLLPANAPILRAISLPECYLVTPDPGADMAGFLARLAARLQQGCEMLRLRAPSYDDQAYAALAQECQALCAHSGTALLLDRGVGMVEEVGAAGLHLTAAALRQLQQRPEVGLLVASCHDRRELETAESISCDFAVLGPVLATATHANAKPLGWAGAAGLIDVANLPVYGIGGLSPAQLPAAFAAGAQGIAAIRGLWPQPVQP